MSYENILILGISREPAKPGQDSRTYVDFEHKVISRFRLGDKFIQYFGEFESAVGQSVMVPLRAGSIDGRPFWALEAPGRPILLPGSAPASGSRSPAAPSVGVPSPLVGK